MDDWPESGSVAEEKVLKWGQSFSEAVFLDASEGPSGKGRRGMIGRLLMRAIEFSGQSRFGPADGSSDGGRICGDAAAKRLGREMRGFCCWVQGRG